MRNGLAGLLIGLLATGCRTPYLCKDLPLNANPDTKKHYERICEVKDDVVIKFPALKAIVLSKPSTAYSLRVELEEDNRIKGIRVVHGDYMLDSYGFAGQLHFATDDANRMIYVINREGAPITSRKRPFIAKKPGPNTKEYFEDIFLEGLSVISDMSAPLGVIPIPRSNVLQMPTEATSSSTYRKSGSQ